MLDAKIETFVRDRAGDTGHSGRTFHEHLTGVYDILREQHAPEHVCLAGLFHSIYGTNAFRHAAVPMAERAAVTELIGKRAERLAHIFCSCQRPRALVEAVTAGPPYKVVNWRDGTSIPLSLEDMCDLLEIEVANLMEQGADSARVALAWRSMIDIAAPQTEKA